jgi:hypothetical protein
MNHFNNAHAHWARSVAAPYSPTEPVDSAMSVCSSIDNYTWSDGEEDIIPPPLEWMQAPVVQPPPIMQLPPPIYAAAARPHVNVVLPPFRASRPAAWFGAVDDVFRLRGITDQRDMFAFAYAKLEEAQLQQVDDIVEMRPLPADAYNRLRDRLVSTHSLDAYQRLEQLIALPALGDQRPTALLAQLLQLCPPGEDKTLFFRNAFLQRLPAIVRMQLAEDRHSPIQALAARADALIVHHQVSSIAPVQLQDGLDVVAAVPGGKFQGKKGKGKKPWEKMSICRFHYKYGAGATRCDTPCSFVSEN